jgi:hypothetical protein
VVGTGIQYSYVKDDKSKAVLGGAHILRGIAIYLCKHAIQVQFIGKQCGDALEYTKSLIQY